MLINDLVIETVPSMTVVALQVLRTEIVLTFALAALVPFKRRGSTIDWRQKNWLVNCIPMHKKPIYHFITCQISPLKVTSTITTSVPPIHNPSPHLIWRLPLFLRVNYLQLPPFHQKPIHLIPCLSSHLWCCILDECKSLRLVGMEILRDVHVANISDSAKRHLKIVLRDVWWNIADEETDSGRAVVATGCTAPASGWGGREISGEAAVGGWGRWRAMAVEETWWRRSIPVVVSS